MDGVLHLQDACTDAHFHDMSRIHALAWKDSYRGAVPQDYLDALTEDHWTEIFRQNYETRNGIHGLLLYRGDAPVACLNYCRARVDNFNTEDTDEWAELNARYRDWGELATFYTLPGEQGKGYGSLLMEEALRRLKADGYHNVFVFVHRENAGARRFYSRHGFAWDGTHADIHFPHNTICVDLRYVRAL